MVAARAANVAAEEATAAAVGTDSAATAAAQQLVQNTDGALAAEAAGKGWAAATAIRAAATAAPSVEPAESVGMTVSAESVLAAAVTNDRYDASGQQRCAVSKCIKDSTELGKALLDAT